MAKVVKLVGGRKLQIKHGGGGGVFAGIGHKRLHEITSPLDHLSAAIPGRMLKADANGMPVNATNTDAQVAAAVTASHARQHALASTSDHISGMTDGQMIRANANGLPVDATNTDAEVAEAVFEAVGIPWKHQVSCINAVGLVNADPGAAGCIGKTYQVGTAWGAWVTGDLVESNGTAWVKIVAANGGGFVPDGTRLIVDAAPSAGAGQPWDGFGDNIAEADGIGGYFFYPPVQGWVAAAIGPSSAFENTIRYYDGAAWVDFETIVTAGLVETHGITIDGGTAVPATGDKGTWTVPAGMTIVGWRIKGDPSGDAVVDVKRSTYAGFPPAASLCGADKPTLTGAIKNQNLALTLWTIALAAGDELGFNLDSVATCKRVTVTLFVTRT
jgi:hypothetical protein